ncbi:hypothetical protein C8R43DRAFT_953074 [Mycena crocata]|nr:hypothetical protein C8R43DRAFT_953074 [Mycena crocata]
MAPEIWHSVADAKALREALSWTPLDDPEADSSELGRLAQQAEDTIWDAFPLCAIADAHKKKAEELARGSSHADAASNAAAVYIEYLKYLRLYPHKNEEDYKKTFALVHLLEEVMNGTASGSAEDLLSDPHSSPSKWKRWRARFLGIFSGALGPFRSGIARPAS